jgi:AI-2 transport protein TqsA
MHKREFLSPGLKTLISAACVVILIAGLRAAAGVLVPLALAVFVAVVSLPVLNGLRALRVPRPLAIVLVILLDIAALLGFGGLVVRAFGDVRLALPAYAVRLAELQASLLAWLAARGVELDPVSYMELFQPERILGLVSVVFFGATGVMSMVFLVLLITVFILAEAASFPLRLRQAIGVRGRDAVRWSGIITQVQHYLALKTLVSMATGLTIGLATWALGIDFALLWGLLAFLLNYIPNVGSVIAALPAVTIALLQHGPGMALALVAVFLAVNVLYGNLIEPTLIGRSLGISTLFVILSLVFWGWVWGIIGMFLSVPLTMALKIVLENTEEFHWIAALMAAAPRDPVPPVAAMPTAADGSQPAT